VVLFPRNTISVMIGEEIAMAGTGSSALSARSRTGENRLAKVMAIRRNLNENDLKKNYLIINSQKGKT
jgi:hypothetical protein